MSPYYSYILFFMEVFPHLFFTVYFYRYRFIFTDSFNIFNCDYYFVFHKCFIRDSNSCFQPEKLMGLVTTLMKRMLYSSTKIRTWVFAPRRRQDWPLPHGTAFLFFSAGLCTVIILEFFVCHICFNTF